MKNAQKEFPQPRVAEHKLRWVKLSRRSNGDQTNKNVVFRTETQVVWRARESVQEHFPSAFNKINQNYIFILLIRYVNCIN